MNGDVAFFEIGVQNHHQGRAFYGSLFGWQMQPSPSGGGQMISTGNVPGGMHGEDPGAAPYLFFLVDDLDGAMARVVELGGVVEEMDVEGDAESIALQGRFKLCKDDQGSPFGLHQRPVTSEAPRRPQATDSETA